MPAVHHAGRKRACIMLFQLVQFPILTGIRQVRCGSHLVRALGFIQLLAVLIHGEQVEFTLLALSLFDDAFQLFIPSCVLFGLVGLNFSFTRISNASPSASIALTLEPDARVFLCGGVSSSEFVLPSVFY